MNWNNINTAVTGSAGFLGSHMCERLVSEGTNVIAIDNYSGGDPKLLEDVEDDIEAKECDIRNLDNTDILENVDILFHFAAIANPRSCQSNFNLAFDVNVSGTKSVFEAAVNAGVNQVLFFSSAAVYGEPNDTPIDESHPRKATDPYSTTKIIGEELANMYHSEYETDFKIIRNFNIFGPRHSTEYLIPTLIKQAIEDDAIEIWTAEAIRDFTYVQDAVNAYISVAESDRLIGRDVNVGSNLAISSSELAERISAEFGDVPVENLDKDTVGSSRLVCDNTLITNETNWVNTIGFEDGLERTIDWYIDNL